MLKRPCLHNLLMQNGGRGKLACRALPFRVTKLNKVRRKQSIFVGVLCTESSVRDLCAGGEWSWLGFYGRQDINCLFRIRPHGSKVEKVEKKSDVFVHDDTTVIAPIRKNVGLVVGLGNALCVLGAVK